MIKKLKCCVVISTYNGEKYILDQLDSIKNQSRKVDKVLICDDCSEDDTFLVINDYIRKNKLSEWKATKNDVNNGWKINFAKLIKMVPKEYDVIFLCDQDDIWMEDKVQIMMSYFENNNFNGMVTSDIQIKYESNNAKIIELEEINGKLDIIPRNLNTLRPGCCMAVSRDMAQECINNLFVDYLPHDMILWMFFYCKKSIYNIKKQLIEYRRFETNATFFEKKSNRLHHKINECKEMICALNQCLLIKDLDEDVLKSICSYLDLEKLKMDVYINKNLYSWLKCIKYIKFYQNIRRWFGDLYYSLIS